MSPVDWAALVGAVVTGVGGVFAGLRFMIKHYLAELKPNSGGSMNDRLVRVERMLEIIIQKI